MSKTLATRLLTREQHVSSTLAARERDVSSTLALKSLETLAGKEKNLLLYVLYQCQFLGNSESSFITSEDLQKEVGVDANRLRNLIYRLSDKGLLMVPDFSTSRSGHRKFVIPKAVYQKLCSVSHVSKTLATRLLTR